MEMHSGNGYLKIWVTTAGRTLPVKGVPVQVLTRDGRLLYSLKTGDGGLTSTVELEAPAASESRKPDPGSKPYATYIIRVDADGFRPVTDADVSIFEGITAIQPVELIPLSTSGSFMPGPPPQIIIPTPIPDTQANIPPFDPPRTDDMTQPRYRPEEDDDEVDV